MYNLGEDRYKIKLYEELGVKGIALSVLSSVFMAAGLCLQKLVQKNRLNDPLSGKVYRNSTYIAGKYHSSCLLDSSFLFYSDCFICLPFYLSSDLFFYPFTSS